MFKALCRSSPEHARHLALSDLLSGRKEHRPLDDVIQLAYVSRPVIFHKPCFSAGRESLARQAEIVPALLEKVFRENRDVFSPLAERGYGDRHHVQPGIKVFAEFSLSHHLRTVPGGGAPVNAPFSWPNSSASSSVSGMAAQFTATNGPFRRRL